MKLVAAIAAAALLAGCGGGGGDQASAAADACEAYAKSQLGDKAYTLDKAVLAKSMTTATDGSKQLRGPIIVDPGTSAESKQTLECSVRFVDGKPAPDVLKMQFIW